MAVNRPNGGNVRRWVLVHDGRGGGLTRKYRCPREIDESGEKWQLSLVLFWFVVGESERKYLDVSRTNVVQY